MPTPTDTEYNEDLQQHSPEVLARLQKLLRLGQQSDNAGEVENAMGRAQALATKHRIDLSRVKVVDVDPITKEPFIEKEHKYGSPVYKPMEVKYIGWILQEYFGVAIIYFERFDKDRRAEGMKHARSLYIRILGRQSDAEFASWVYEYLRDVFPKLWRKEKARHNMSMDQRRSYYYGLYRGISVALQRAKEATEQAEFAALPADERKQTESSYQLALVGEAEALKQALADKHPVLRKMKQRPGNIYDPAARAAGFDAGLKVKIQRALNGTSKGALK